MRSTIDRRRRAHLALDRREHPSDGHLAKPNGHLISPEDSSTAVLLIPLLFGHLAPPVGLNDFGYPVLRPKNR